MKSIGILSGMGAAAGVRFYGLMIKECQRKGAKKDSDFPKIVLYNMPAKGMDAKGVADELIIKDELLEGIALLNSLKVDLIIIACNTVHIYHKFLQKHSSARILNMVESAIAVCEKNSTKFGVICSATSRDAGLYTKAIQVTRIQQNTVDKIIGNVIAGKSKKKDRTDLKKIIASMFNRGAHKIILGCTELPLVSPKHKNIIDAGKVVVEEALSL